jgi:outer membrane protein OmpA-like peptidoglycan-associated protein
MKKISLVFVLLFCASAGLLAQTPAISSVEVNRNGASADVAFRVEVPRRAVASDESMALLPVITDGTYRVSLPAVIVQGKRAARLQQRHDWVSDREIDYVRARFVAPGESLTYRASVAMQQWMEGATLRLESLSWGCCSSEEGNPRTLASNLMPYQQQYTEVVEQPVPDLPKSTGDTLARTFRFVIPESQYRAEEPIYDDDRENALIIYYRQGRSVIDPTFDDNRQTLENLTAAVDALVASRDSRISRIVVAGFASPEGSYLQNDRLAWDRAISVKEHIMKNSGVEDATITVFNGSEDWRGLRALVAASSLADKDQILNIIDTVPTVGDGGAKPRLDALRRLNGGASYNYLYENAFPLLRNGAFIRVYYRNTNTQ